MAGLSLLPVFHHLVSKNPGPVDQKTLPLIVTRLRPPYRRRREIAFGYQRSTKILIPNDPFSSRTSVHLVGVHMRLLLMR